MAAEPGEQFPNWQGASDALKKILNAAGRAKMAMDEARQRKEEEKGILPGMGNIEPESKAPLCGDCSLPMQKQRDNRYMCLRHGVYAPTSRKSKKKEPETPPADDRQGELF